MCCDASLTDVLQVFRTIHRLKELPRQGFVHFGYKTYETDAIAEHSFMVAWVSYVLATELELEPEEVETATTMALVHDWGEAVMGDISYHVKLRDRTRDALTRLEARAFERLTEELCEDVRDRLRSLCREYEAGETLCAGIVAFADGLDAWLQGLSTPSTWWPAWEEYNRGKQRDLAGIDERCRQGQGKDPGLAGRFRRICDLARDPDVSIRRPDPELDREIQPMLRFLKTIYCLKELPRHGFTIFGMKRTEADTFAGHCFTTASLAYLLATGPVPLERGGLLDVIMLGLAHDLPTAVTGDAAFDLQAAAPDVWKALEDEALGTLTAGLKCRRNVQRWFRDYRTLKGRPALVARAAAAIDAWEIGVTTPSAWMQSCLDHNRFTVRSVAMAEQRQGLGAEVSECLRQSCRQLAEYEDVLDTSYQHDCRVGREPVVRPVRLR